MVNVPPNHNAPDSNRWQIAGYTPQNGCYLAISVALFFSTPLHAQDDNARPGSWFGIHTAGVEIHPQEEVMAALDADCRNDADEACDEATMFVISDAIVKIAAEQAEPRGGEIFLPQVPEAAEHAVEALEGLQQELQDFLSAGATNDVGYPTAITGSVITLCGELAYTYNTEVEYAITRDASGEVDRFDNDSPFDDITLITSITLSGSCDCQEINGRQVRDIQYTYTNEKFADLRSEDRIEFTSKRGGQCYNRSSCDCPVIAEADAFPASDAYVLNFDSPLFCTYGGGQILLVPGVTRPPMTPVPSPLLPPGSQPQQDNPGLLPPVPGSNPEATPARTTGVTIGYESLPDPALARGEPNPVPIPYPDGSPPLTTDTVQMPGTTTRPPTDGPQDSPDTVPAVTALTIKATTATLTGGANVAAAGALIQLNTGVPALAGDPGALRDDSGAAESELSASTDDDGNAVIMVPTDVANALGTTTIDLEVNPSVGTILGFPGNVEPADVLPSALLAFAQPSFALAGSTFIPLLIPEHQLGTTQPMVDSAGTTSIEPDICVDPKPLADPYFSSTGSWQQSYADQWAIQSVGFTEDDDSAWNLLADTSEPVTIAVIDSGLDWNHLDIDWDVLWKNDGEIAANGIDDDGNGYVDDTIGWDFWDNDRTPWDFDGHGTFVAGILFANPGNDAGIAGISRNARLMVLKVMNAFGHSRASKVAQAIMYATDNGARVINLSLGGPGTSDVVQQAINYAYERNVLVVVAAGNEAKPAEDQVVSGVANALTVAAVGVDSRRSIYSNYGAGIDVAAPGDDILSLRARRTDLLKNIPDVEYTAASAFVGDDRRYYRASGTSFAAPIVAGVAGLAIANRPELTVQQVMRVIKQSARDIEKPGVDHYSGYGVVDAVAAMRADPEYYVDAEITGVEVLVDGASQLLQINGIAAADRFSGATLQIGKGEDPTEWTEVASADTVTNGGAIAAIPASNFAGSPQWTIRLVVEHATGETREFWFLLNLG